VGNNFGFKRLSSRPNKPASACWADLQHGSHVRGRALQLAIQPAVLRVRHQHRDDIPRVKAQQGPVGARGVRHNSLHSCHAAPPPAFAAAAGLAEGTRTGGTASWEQTCREASAESGWSPAPSCMTHAASKGPALPQSNNDPGGTDGLSLQAEGRT